LDQFPDSLAQNLSSKDCALAGAAKETAPSVTANAKVTVERIFASLLACACLLGRFRHESYGDKSRYGPREFRGLSRFWLEGGGSMVVGIFGPGRFLAMSIESAAGGTPILPRDLGEIRTIMAADRTLMAWIRTSLSMLSFGFTIYKFLDALAEQGQLAASRSPQRVGLALCAMAAIAILLGTSGYWVTLNDIKRAGEFRLGRPVLVMALIMCVASLFMLVGIANRLV
jgi:putative membrane protein